MLNKLRSKNRLGIKAQRSSILYSYVLSWWLSSIFYAIRVLCTWLPYMVMISTYPDAHQLWVRVLADRHLSETRLCIFGILDFFNCHFLSSVLPTVTLCCVPVMIHCCHFECLEIWSLWCRDYKSLPECWGVFDLFCGIKENFRLSF